MIDAARAELAQIEETDEMERSDASERAHAQLDRESLLFGTAIRTVTSHAAGGSR